MKILYVYSDQQGCCYYRCIVPGKALSTIGHDVVITDLFNPDTLTHDEDICILQRHSDPKALWLMGEKRKAGIPCVVETDDDYFNIPLSNPGSALFRKPKVQRVLKDLLRYADGITCPTHPLAASLRQRGGPVYVLPNYLDTHPSAWPEPVKRMRDFRVFWTGSDSHRADIQPLYDGMRTLLKPDGGIKFVVLSGIFQELEKCDHNSVELYPPMRWVDSYLDMLALTPAHIGLAPLEATTFNRSKSWLKALEYGMAGMLPVLQDWTPYQDIPEAGTLLPLVDRNTGKAWTDAILALRSKPDEVRSAAFQWQDLCRTKYLITNNIWRWERAYEAIINGKRNQRPFPIFESVPDGRPEPQVQEATVAS